MNERVRIIGTALITGAIALEGCGGNNTPTFIAEPIKSPDATMVVPTTRPSPTEIVLPSQSPTITATPEISPSPKPTPTLETGYNPSPITFENVINDLNKGGQALDKYKKPISIAALKTSFEALLKSPAAFYITEPKQFDSCTNSKMDIRTKQLACFYFTYDSLTAAEKTADPAAIDFAQKLMRYDLTKVYLDEKVVKNLAEQLQFILKISENNN